MRGLDHVLTQGSLMYGLRNFLGLQTEEKSGRRVSSHAGHGDPGDRTSPTAMKMQE